MSFGWSAGDLWTAAKALYDLAKRYHDAPHQFDNLFSELYGLSRVLQDVDRLTLSGANELSQKERTELNQIAANCEEVYADTQKLLQKYLIVGSGNTLSLGSKAKRTWKRLTMEPENFKEVRSRITSNILVLETYITVSAAVKTSAIDKRTSKISGTIDRLDINVHKAIDFVELERRQNLLRWISDLDHEAILADISSRRQPGTGQWFLDGSEFQEWCSKPDSVLLCVGNPGTGKTIMTTIIVEHIESVYGSEEQNGIAYFYCNFNRSDNQQTMFSSILRQLIARQCASHALYSKLQQCRLSDKRLSVAEIKAELLELCSGLAKFFLVLDALDEGHFIQSKEFRDFMSQLQDVTDLRLLLTSRPIPEITKHFDHELCMDLQAHNEDISSYIKARGCDMVLVARRPDLLDLMTASIIKAADGIFLLAKLHLDSLLDKPTPKALKTALDRLPTGSSAYDRAYESAMARIQVQPSGRSHLAVEALTWIVHAKRELSKDDLLHAMATELETSEQDADNLPELDDILSSCAGLIIWHAETDKVKLVHYTAQEYFSRHKAQWFDNGEASLALTCVTYLSYDTWPKAGRRFKTEQIPFYLYASTYWGEHCKAGNINFDSVTTFLQDDPKINTVFRNSANPLTSILRGRTTSSLNLCVYFNLGNYITELLARDVDINFGDGLGRTPLHIAVACGNVDLVQTLLQYPQLDLNKTNKSGNTALHYACWQGFLELVLVLLADQRLKLHMKEGLGRYITRQVGIDDQRDELSREAFAHTPATFTRALTYDSLEIFRVLLEDDRFDVNFMDARRYTPLSDAVYHRDVSLLKFLLSRDDLDLAVCNYGTPILHQAAKQCLHKYKMNDSEVVLQLLLNDSRVDPNAEDGSGNTVLDALINSPEYEPDRYYCIAVAKLLLKNDRINSTIAGTSNGTALYAAADKNSLATVKLLLEYLGRCNCDPNGTHECTISIADHMSPLFPAINNGNRDMVKVLLDNGANPNATNERGCSALIFAVRIGDLAIIRLLIAAKADVDLPCYFYRRMPFAMLTLGFTSYSFTALSWAIANGSLEIVKLLVEEGNANVRLRDEQSLLPVDIARILAEMKILDFLEDAARTQPLGSSTSRSARRGSWACGIACQTCTTYQIHRTEVPWFLRNTGDDLSLHEKERLWACFESSKHQFIHQIKMLDWHMGYLLAVDDPKSDSIEDL